MLRDDDHLRATTTMGTLHPEDQDDPALRYGGYLGRHFASGEGVLVIYGIHREFRSENLRTDPGHLVDGYLDATRRLQQANEPGDAIVDDYLNTHRAMYEAGLSGGWRVAGHLKAALPACGVSLDREGMSRIAYVNVSCCQFPELHKHADDTTRKNKLKRDCSRRHPVAEVVRMLRPMVVLCASSWGYRSLREAGVGGVLATVFYNQNGGYLQQPIEFLDGHVVPAGTRRADWTQALREQVTRARTH